MSWHHVKNKDEMEAFFKSVLPAIKQAAKECGYAIGVHGSLRRDLDLIAVPWIEEHLDKDTLARAVHKAACPYTMDKYNWEAKPCGRFATAFPICWTDWKKYEDPIELSLGHIDLSVIGSRRRTTSGTK